jgi:hypothetical protein
MCMSSQQACQNCTMVPSLDAMAALIQYCIEGRPEEAVFQQRLALWPVQLLALVIGMIATAPVSVVLA